MNWFSNDLVGLISYLLPGFLAAWVFFGFTAHPKPAPFERVVQALIFTALTQGIVSIVRWTCLGIGTAIGTVDRPWTQEVAFVWSLGVAIILGLLISRWANNDSIHFHLRKRGFTNQTSRPTAWYGAFQRNDGYVVLHLDGERRLYGWPAEWPSDPENGHFLVSHAEWLGDENEGLPLSGVSRILVPASEVIRVEFMRNVDADKIGAHDGSRENTPTSAPA